MARPLDGTALLAYFRQFGFSRVTQELLVSIRSWGQHIQSCFLYAKQEPRGKEEVIEVLLRS